MKMLNMIYAQELSYEAVDKIPLSIDAQTIAAQNSLAKLFNSTKHKIKRKCRCCCCCNSWNYAESLLWSISKGIDGIE